MRELDQDSDTRAGGDREASAESLDAFAHAAEAVAFSDFWLHAVIGDEERVIAVLGPGEAYAALRGFGVADDVGDGFADGETEDGLFRCVELRDRGFAGESNTRGLQGFAGLLHLGGETLRAVATDGLADFAEGGASGLFYIGDLLGCTLWVAFDEPAGEFGLKDDDGEGVSENVVEVAGDAFAFGYGGEGYVLFLGEA